MLSPMVFVKENYTYLSYFITSTSLRHYIFKKKTVYKAAKSLSVNWKCSSYFNTVAL